ncbi:MAG: hypothetical protein WCQ90_03655 [Deltaproteobacteria bacterium]
MEGMIRYCVVKKSKGLFKKKSLYTHLLFVPVDPAQYMYLALVSQMTEEDNTYVAQLLVKLTDEIMEDTLRGEYEHFGKKFVEVEALKCKSSNPSQGKYIVNIPRKGSYIKSDLEIEYQVEYSIVDKRMYLLKGELDLIPGDAAS